MPAPAAARTAQSTPNARVRQPGRRADRDRRGARAAEARAGQAAGHPVATTTGAEIFWETVQSEGVDTVFGYPGSAILPIYDAMQGRPIHHVLARHEQGAAHVTGRADTPTMLALPFLP